MRSAMLTPYAAAVRELGLDPRRMLKAARIPPGALETHQEPISLRRYQDLLEMTAVALKRSDIGLLVASRYGLSLAGPVGLLARHQPNLLSAIESVKRYLGHQVDSVALRCEPVAEGRLVSPVLNLPAATLGVQVAELMTGVLVRTFRDLIGGDWRPAKVLFTHRAPADLSTHRAFLGDVAFEQPANGVLLTHADLARPIAGADPALAAEVARFIEMSQRPSASMTYVEEVNTLIARLLPLGRCTIDQVAGHLGVDRRTVHRHLAAENAHFSDLVDAMRRRIVEAELTRDEVRLSEVAERVGFSSGSTFSRWFLHAYGVTPSRFRRDAHAP